MISTLPPMHFVREFYSSTVLGTCITPHSVVCSELSLDTIVRVTCDGLPASVRVSHDDLVRDGAVPTVANAMRRAAVGRWLAAWLVESTR